MYSKQSPYNMNEVYINPSLNNRPIINLQPEEGAIYPSGPILGKNVNNGRVNIMEPNTKSLFQLYDKIPAHQCTTYQNAVEGIWDTNTISTQFFSRENIQRLQNGIREGVYNKSNGQYTIAPQDCDTLKIIMRSIYLQYGANRGSNVEEQIRDLNRMVLDYAIPQVYGEAQGYMNYLKDASTMYVPIAHPVMPQDRDKLLEFKSWF